jgi:hypothetical protein
MNCRNHARISPQACLEYRAEQMRKNPEVNWCTECHLWKRAQEFVDWQIPFLAISKVRQGARV